MITYSMINTSTFSQEKNFITSHVSIDGDVTNPSNSIDANLSTYAELECWTLPLGVGPHAKIVNQFSSNLPTGTDIYIAVSQPDGAEFLRSLIGGTLGGLVNSVLEGLIAGTPTIDIRLRTSSGTVVTTQEMTPSSSNQVFYGSEGIMYLKVTSTGTFSRVEVDISNPAFLGMGNNMILRVHDIFYVTPTPDPCDAFYLTYYDALGLNVSLVTDNGSPISNPHHAIDGNNSTYSELGYNGVVSLYLGSTIKQTILFDEISTANEQPVITFDRNASLLTLDLLNAMQIDVYNGSSSVYSGTAGSLLSLDALGILSATIIGGIPDKISIPVSAPFNKVVVSYSQTVGLGVTDQPLKIYEITKGPKKPILTSSTINGCDGLPTEVSVTSPTSGITYNWYNSDLDLIHTGTDLEYVFPASGTTDTILVQSVNECGVTSQFEYVLISGQTSICLTSEMSGYVELAGYISSNPLNAVLTDTFNVVDYSTEVDESTGDYTFDAVAKGVYNIHIINEDVEPGDIVSESQVDPGHTITGPTVRYVVLGDGSDVTFGDFEISMPPLSSQIISLQGHYSEGIIHLTWEVPNDNYRFYTIEMSQDGKNFTSISDKINHIENTKKYVHPLNNLPNYTNYFFRIKAQNSNNQNTFSSIIKLSNPNNHDYVIYPNPSSDIININLKGHESLKLFNAIGQKINMESHQNGQINIKHLSEGLYYLGIYSEGEHILIPFKKTNK